MGRKKKKQKSNLDLQVAILFIASIVLAILIYGKPGVIGQNVIPQLENAIGWIQYFVPIAIFTIAVHLACEEDKRTLGISGSDNNYNCIQWRYRNNRKKYY